MEIPSYLYFVLISIPVFNVFGLFGNINMIILFVRQFKCRTNYGYLLTILCISQSICLFFEFFNVYFAIGAYFFGKPIYRSECFHVLFPYVFFNAFQADVVAAIAVDFFLCVSVPLQYLRFKRRFYLPLLLLFPFSHGFYLVLFGFIYTNDEQIKLCNPPSSLSYAVVVANYSIFLAVSVVTLVAYSSGFTILYLKSRSQKRVAVERKAMRSIQVLVLIFLLNRFTVFLFVNLLHIFGATDELKVIAHDVLLICALFFYSENFYVCYFRSSEYRSMLNSQLRCKATVTPTYSGKLTII